MSSVALLESHGGRGRGHGNPFPARCSDTQVVAGCFCFHAGAACSSKVQDLSRVRRLQVLDLPRKTFKSWSESQASFILVEKKEEARAWGLLGKKHKYPSEWTWVGSPVSSARGHFVLGILCVWGGGCLQASWHQILTPPAGWEGALLCALCRGFLPLTDSL